MVRETDLFLSNLRLFMQECNRESRENYYCARRINLYVRHDEQFIRFFRSYKYNKT